MADKQSLIADNNIYALTRKGEAELRGARTTLPSSALDLLVRIDGRSTVGAIRSTMTGVSSDQVASTFEWLVHSGLIETARPRDDGALDFDAPSGFAAPLVPSASAVSTATREDCASFRAAARRCARAGLRAA